VNYGLNKSQVLFLLQRLSPEIIYQRLNNSITFNNYYDQKDSRYYRRKIWFDNETKEEIKNLGGFLYSKVFPELNDKT
jgi:hypothetical protein